jgi:hypothetical protein
MSSDFRILYCHCAYARVVPPEVKAGVLKRLAESGREFDAVPDLCEMSARKDARLAEYARCGHLKIVACFPRAVRGLFRAAGQELGDGASILNMRTASAEAVAAALITEQQADE